MTENTPYTKIQLYRDSVQRLAEILTETLYLNKGILAFATSIHMGIDINTVEVRDNDLYAETVFLVIPLVSKITLIYIIKLNKKISLSKIPEITLDDIDKIALTITKKPLEKGEITIVMPLSSINNNNPIGGISYVQ